MRICLHYGSIFIQIFVVGSERRIFSAIDRVHIGRWRSAKVVDFGTNRKGVCDILLVINSNIGPILSRFRDIEVFPRRATPPYSTRSLWTRLPMLWLRGAKTLKLQVITRVTTFELLQPICPWYINVTDGRMKGIIWLYDINSALALRASRSNNLYFSISSVYIYYRVCLIINEADKFMYDVLFSL